MIAPHNPKAYRQQMMEGFYNKYQHSNGGKVSCGAHPAEDDV
jgi:hypothetical protein